MNGKNNYIYIDAFIDIFSYVLFLINLFLFKYYLIYLLLILSDLYVFYYY